MYESFLDVIIWPAIALGAGLVLLALAVIAASLILLIVLLRRSRKKKGGADSLPVEKSSHEPPQDGEGKD